MQSLRLGCFAFAIFWGMPGVGLFARFQPPGRGPQPVLLHWSDAEFVFVGKLTKVQAGPVARSLPPIYNHTLTFEIAKVLRGELKAGEIFSGHHAARQLEEPIFPEDRVCIVAGAKTRNGWSVNRIEEADEQKIKDVETLCKLPLGWNNDDGKILSPWAEHGKKAWPKDATLRAELVCSKSGRPALLCGPGVKLTVEAVPPKKTFEFKNPDGDGQYEITVTNTTKEPLAIPALLADGDKILWANSLLIQCQKHVYRCPDEQELSAGVRSVTLKPGESVSTTVDVLKLKGPEWPRGGSRVEFQFCLGELSSTKSLYYYSTHHDPLREAAQK